MLTVATWILSHLARARSDEDGAVSVDFVVLTAVIATIGLVTISVIRGGVYDVASDIYSNLTDSMQ